MSCTPVTASMLDLLGVLQNWPDVDVEKVRSLPEWDQARSWGWIMDSGELTGSGWRHLHVLPRGLVAE
jgi:hypothetical protein